MKGFNPHHDRLRRVYAGAPSGRRTAAFRELRQYTAHLLEMSVSERRRPVQRAFAFRVVNGRSR